MCSVCVYARACGIQVLYPLKCLSLPPNPRGWRVGRMKGGGTGGFPH